MLVIMPNESTSSADFCIEIDYQKKSDAPSRVFKAMSSLIETFESIDKDLLVSIDSNLQTTLMLEDMETGSLKVWLANRLRGIDDDGLKSGDWKKMVGPYLARAKYVMIDFLDGKTTISDQKQLTGLQADLLQLAEDTHVRQLPAYVPVDKTKLLAGIEGITSALANLRVGDAAKYITDDLQASFNMGFRYIPEQMEELFTRETLSGGGEAIVQIKKPDYLGDSMWEFRHVHRPIYAKMMDNEWLQKFRDRKIDLRPGDSLRVMLLHKVNYDFDNHPISERYEIAKVIEILQADRSAQSDIFQQGDA